MGEAPIALDVLGSSLPGPAVVLFWLLYVWNYGVTIHDYLCAGMDVVIHATLYVGCSSAIFIVQEILKRERSTTIHCDSLCGQKKHICAL